MAIEFSESMGTELLKHCGYLYQPCISCTQPMIGIFKEHPDNANVSRLARETCFICTKVEEEQARFDRTGTVT